MKVCTKCKILLNNSDFYKDKKSSNGLRQICKACFKLYNHIHNKIYYRNNSEKESQRKKEYYQNNKDVIKSRNKIWSKNNADKIKRRRNEYLRERRFKDNNFRVRYYIRNRFNQAMKSYSFCGKDGNIAKYGIDIKEITEHLGGRPGEDYTIDHIIPLCQFNFNNPNHIMAAFIPENHQWLLSQDNFRKNKFIENSSLAIKTLNLINKFLVKMGDNPLNIEVK